MATHLSCTWTPSHDDFGSRRHRKPCQYSPYVPDLLSAISLTLPPDIAADVVDAEVALGAFDQATDPALDHLARYLLRAEAVASSHIEGLTVSARRLARREAAQLHGSLKRDDTADAVLGNIFAMREAVGRLSLVDAIDVAHINELHAAILGTNHPQAGKLRTEQNWIGGNSFGPCTADFVPPPPDRVTALLDDLCEFANRDDLPAVQQAALIHAHFETIHPYVDGNGRTGRALIHAVLRRRGSATHFVPPVSLSLASHAHGYVNALMAYRYVGAPTSKAAQSAVTDWLTFFVAALRRSVVDAQTLASDLQALEVQWRSYAKLRKGSAADRLIPHLATHPIVTVAEAAALVDVSYPAANSAVARLVAAGVLTPSPGTRNRSFEAHEVFTIMTRYERAAATPSGDTRTDKPVRAVPDRVRRR